MYRVTSLVIRSMTVAAVMVLLVTASSCSAGVDHGRYVTHPAPNNRLLLVPELRGGRAGLCLWKSTRRLGPGPDEAEGSSGCSTLQTSRGPIFDTGGCGESERGIQIYALTTSAVAAVSVYGGDPVRTTTNSTFPDGLRAVAVEVLRHNGQPSIEAHCPRLTPLDAKLQPLRRAGKHVKPLRFAASLQGARRWDRGVPGEHPRWNARRPAHGACELQATQLPRETSARWGDVATVIRPVKQLVGRALLSCVDTTYFYLEEHALDAAVLLNALHPGATPPPLPGMKPLAGHPGVFEAPGDGNQMAARRIRGAWLAVEENDGIGLSVPVELLEHLRATIRMK